MSLLDSQMEFFLNLLEKYKSGTHSYTDHLQICLKEDKRLVLETGQSEEEVKRILSDVYSKGFRNFQTRG
jgi:hypothetical protein